MTMPQIPEEKHRPSLEETVIDLLESIALEEIAISHSINAEAEKNQAIICKLFNDDQYRGLHELVKCSENTCKIIDSVIIKEWLLLKKMEAALEIGSFHKGEQCNPGCDKHKNCLCKCCNCTNNTYLTCKFNENGLTNNSDC